MSVNALEMIRSHNGKKGVFITFSLMNTTSMFCSMMGQLLMEVLI